MTRNENKPAKLLFIYNAKSGLGNAVLDGLHKIIQPATYDCNLCAITFGKITEKRVWKEFRERSKIPMEFLHSDEFSKQYASKFGHKFSFPIVLTEGNNGLEVLISMDILNSLNSAEDLISTIETLLPGLV